MTARLLVYNLNEQMSFWETFSYHWLQPPCSVQDNYAIRGVPNCLTICVIQSHTLNYVRKPYTMKFELSYLEALIYEKESAQQYATVLLKLEKGKIRVTKAWQKVAVQVLIISHQPPLFMAHCFFSN
jgi:hypothetical protein